MGLIKTPSATEIVTFPATAGFVGMHTTIMILVATLAGHLPKELARQAAPPATWLTAIGQLPRGGFKPPAIQCRCYTMQVENWLRLHARAGFFRWTVRCGARGKICRGGFVSSGKSQHDDCLSAGEITSERAPPCYRLGSSQLERS